MEILVRATSDTSNRTTADLVLGLAVKSLAGFLFWCGVIAAAKWIWSTL